MTGAEKDRAEAQARIDRAEAVLNGYRRRRQDAIARQRNMIKEIAKLCQDGLAGLVSRELASLSLAARCNELAAITEAIEQAFTNGEDREALAELATARAILQSLS